MRRRVGTRRPGAAPPEQAPAEQPIPAAPPASSSVVVDPINELVIIAAGLVDWELGGELCARFTADFFQTPEHKALWEVLREMHARALAWDPETLRTLGGDPELATGLMQARPEVPPNLGHHLDVLTWDRARAETARGPLTALLAAMHDPRTPPDRVRALGEQVTQSLAQGGTALRLMVDGPQLVQSVAANLEQRRTGIAVHPYGLDGLDAWDHDSKVLGRDGRPRYHKGDARMIPGTSPGRVTVVTGASGGGKSTITARIALAQVQRQRRVAYGAWEVDAPMTIEMLATLSLGLSRSAVMSGDFDEETQQRIIERVRELEPWVRFMHNPVELPDWKYDPRGGEHNYRALAWVEEFLASSGAEVFIGDLWDRAFAFSHEAQEREALARQQAMARRLGVHAILLQQQKIKELEQQRDKRPTRHLIKGSSAWVDVADTILGVHLPALWKDVPDDTIELLVLKQRFGTAPLAVEFRWDGDLGELWDGRSVPFRQTAETVEDGPGLDGFVTSKTRRK